MKIKTKKKIKKHKREMRDRKINVSFSYRENKCFITEVGKGLDDLTW